MEVKFVASFTIAWRNLRSHLCIPSRFISV